MNQPLQSLEQLLDRVSQSTRDNDQVSVGMVIESVGSRSFGPMLMLIGITLFSPLSGLPGMSIFMGSFVLLIAVQILIGRKQFWLPHFILNRSIGRRKLQKALHWLNKPARSIDRVLKPRLTFLVRNGGSYGIASLCIVVGLCMPFMELVPFSSSAAGLALLALGLALVVHDGLLVLLALGAFSATLILIVANIL
ncbi:exopolysaccharide biosynthesis protein [Halomonas janggokensis]|uniref:Exopolysaccharide biosynthesis protein n=1 Tax=Vreelandella janggokensis TaxID=370767 RepID=A0ABT4ITL6_9GAMM|nr:exopolysaccharide biosynthesis protein [Halomonas janggokensis]MCZ0926988.1 exopolysaccharide biosynthesis protein [Halomonas janggokensis]MCZ0929526.1 exopolysaccharide biosynthesis protein [Halomonas janggokensis]